ncbi:hypothetical protein [Mesorhizobium denitrificans]|uniref:hypothetical protein n=1 Tax=Mesorhizobium denitrificans TaxID=2294114 RepID=UPI001314F86B|nr:hypothetical protein [Mesorhizobium denitrificans]
MMPENKFLLPDSTVVKALCRVTRVLEEAEKAVADGRTVAARSHLKAARAHIDFLFEDYLRAFYSD